MDMGMHVDMDMGIGMQVDMGMDEDMDMGTGMGMDMRMDMVMAMVCPVRPRRTPESHERYTSVASKK